MRDARWRSPRHDFFALSRETIAAVTGTSGKTSVAAFTRQIWAATGEQAASIGTIGLVSPNARGLRLADNARSRRAAPLARRARRTRALLIWRSRRPRTASTSIASTACAIAAGGFTNISRDHLDYHPTLRGLSRRQDCGCSADLVQPRGAAVIDVDHEHADAVLAAAKQRRLAAAHGRPSWRRHPADRNGHRRLRADHEGRAWRQHLYRPAAAGRRLPGRECTGRCRTWRLPPTASRQPCSLRSASLKGAKGRLDLVGEKDGAPIFVDYAHKPDALAKALEALRPYARGRLVVVFGAGGDRDAGKRPMMGEIAAAKADRVIVTDDNPRSEEPAAIRAAILKAVTRARSRSATAAKRSARRLRNLRRGDVLLIAGKGHESGQIVGNQTLPFSDHDAVAAALERKLA